MNETIGDRLEAIEDQIAKLRKQLGTGLKGMKYKNVLKKKNELQDPVKQLELLIEYPPLIEVEYPLDGYATGELLKFAGSLRSMTDKHVMSLYKNKKWIGAVEETGRTDSATMDKLAYATIVREIQIRRYKIDRREYL